MTHEICEVLIEAHDELQKKDLLIKQLQAQLMGQVDHEELKIAGDIMTETTDAIKSLEKDLENALD
jgi:hypothetical protein